MNGSVIYLILVLVPSAGLTFFDSDIEVFFLGLKSYNNVLVVFQGCSIAAVWSVSIFMKLLQCIGVILTRCLKLSNFVF